MISVVVPVTERAGDIESVLVAYSTVMEDLARPYELICVLDGGHLMAHQILDGLAGKCPRLRLIELPGGYGESAALTAGFRASKGSLIVSLPAYFQIEPDEIGGLIEAAQGHDMAIARRWPRRGSKWNMAQAWCFSRVVKVLMRCSFDDLGCGARVFRREVLEEIGLYGDQHRFFPLITHAHGFSVCQFDARQSVSDMNRRAYRPGLYVRRLLDILGIYFLLKFTHKPLRFFGLVGFAAIAGGVLVMAQLVAARVFFSVALLDRPLVLAAGLAIVLGVQFLALGLIGELIIFVHGKELRSYRVAETLDHNRTTAEEDAPGRRKPSEYRALAG